MREVHRQNNLILLLCNPGHVNCRTLKQLTIVFESNWKNSD